jgi:hypothetical protein
MLLELRTDSFCSWQFLAKNQNAGYDRHYGEVRRRDTAFDGVWQFYFDKQAQSIFLLAHKGHNPLKNLDSDERIQEKPRKTNLRFMVNRPEFGARPS